jgi:hypothetical protein
MKKMENSEPQKVRKKGGRVHGRRRDLIEEGVRIMTCIKLKPELQTRFKKKDFLVWKDEKTGKLFDQYFNHPEEGYSMSHKAVENFMVATGTRSREIRWVDLGKLVGLRAKVTVETVRPKHAKGPLKGKVKDDIFHYSKVGDIIEPIDWNEKIRKSRRNSDD